MPPLPNVKEPRTVVEPQAKAEPRAEIKPRPDEEWFELANQYIDAAFKDGSVANERKFIARLIKQEFTRAYAEFLENIKHIQSHIPFSEVVLRALWEIAKNNFSKKIQVLNMINALCKNDVFYVKQNGKERLVPATFVITEPGVNKQGKEHNLFCGFKPKNDRGPTVGAFESEIQELFINPQAILPIVLLGKLLQVQADGLKVGELQYTFSFPPSGPSDVSFIAHLFADVPTAIATVLDFQSKHPSPNGSQQELPGVFRFSRKQFRASVEPATLSEKELSIKEYISALTRVIQLIPNAYLRVSIIWPTAKIDIKLPNELGKEAISDDVRTALYQARALFYSLGNTDSELDGATVNKLFRRISSIQNIKLTDDSNPSALKKVDSFKLNYYTSGSSSTLASFYFRDAKEFASV